MYGKQLFYWIGHFSYIFNKLEGNSKPRKSCPNMANQNSLGEKINMIKILFYATAGFDGHDKMLINQVF